MTDGANQGEMLSRSLAEMLQGVDGMVRRQVDVAEAGGPALFPNGITRVHASLTVDGVGSASIELEGPASASVQGIPGVASASREPSEGPPPRIDRIEPTQWVAGGEGDLVIIGRNFRRPFMVSSDHGDVSFDNLRMESATRLRAHVMIDEEILLPGGGTTAKVKVSFDNEDTIEAGVLQIGPSARSGGEG